MTEAEAKRAGAAGPGGLHELRGARDRGDLSGVALEDDPGGAARQYLATLPGDLLCTGATWARGVKEGAGEERVAPFVDTEFLGAWDYRLSVCGVWWWEGSPERSGLLRAWKAAQREAEFASFLESRPCGAARAAELLGAFRGLIDAERRSVHDVSNERFRLYRTCLGVCPENTRGHGSLKWALGLTHGVGLLAECRVATGRAPGVPGALEELGRSWSAFVIESARP